jgi:CTP:phosphocholine cytidylyltransferase-like protein
MIKPTVAEEEIEVSQKPNIEDKTIQELLEMDPDMFPVIIVKSFSVPPFKYIKNELNVFIIQFLSYMMQPQGFKCTATIS